MENVTLANLFMGATVGTLVSLVCLILVAFVLWALRGERTRVTGGGTNVTEAARGFMESAILMVAMIGTIDLLMIIVKGEQLVFGYWTAWVWIVGIAMLLPVIRIHDSRE